MAKTTKKKPALKAKTKAHAVKQKTIVTFLLDRSSSMNSIKSATIEAFNGYLSELQKAPDLIDFTFLQFDSQSLDKICVAEPVASVPALNDRTYQPRGSTPLIDSSVQTIRAVESAIQARDDKPKVVICIQTDGEENCSREFSWDYLSALVKEKTEAGWQFNFMGAGIDAYQQGSRMGISAAQTMSYNSADRDATRVAFAAGAANTRSFAMGISVNTAYSGAQKMAAGDIYDVGLNPAPRPAAQPPRGVRGGLNLKK